MKKTSICIAICILAISKLFAQEEKIEGYWLTSEKRSQIQIVQKPDGKFYGKIVWLEEPYTDDGILVRDKENPDPTKRNQKILGLQILKGFSYDVKDQRWEDGTIYDPETGKTYECRMWLEDHQKTLNVKGYIGVSFMGRTTEWTRENKKRTLNSK